MRRPRIPSKARRQRAARRSPGTPRQSKTAATATSKRGWEVKVGAVGWLPAWRGHRPRVGGSHITRYRNFGRIKAVRPAGER